MLIVQKKTTLFKLYIYINIDFSEDFLERCTAAYPMLDGDMHRESGLVRITVSNAKLWWFVFNIF